MRKNFKVYIHINKINNKKYIGITGMSISKRWGNGGNGYKTQIFYNAIQKYGWDNFEHKVLLKNLTESEAKEAEINLIAEFKTNNKKFGYNQTCGGDSISEKARKKIAIANSKRIVSQETRIKMSESSKGKSHTEESKKKISQSKKGYVRNEESKIKQSKNHKDVRGKK